MNAFEEIDAPVDEAQVYAKVPGQPLITHPSIDGAADHLMPPDGRESVYALVVSVGLVILGDQAECGMLTKIFLDQQPRAAVEQHESRLAGSCRITDKGYIKPISRMKETACLCLRGLITSFGMYLPGIRVSSGIW